MLYSVIHVHGTVVILSWEYGNKCILELNWIYISYVNDQIDLICLYGYSPFFITQIEFRFLSDSKSTFQHHLFLLHTTLWFYCLIEKHKTAGLAQLWVYWPETKITVPGLCRAAVKGFPWCLIPCLLKTFLVSNMRFRKQTQILCS